MYAPNVKYISASAFSDTYVLEELNFPNAIVLYSYAFGKAGAKRIFVPNVQFIPSNCFYYAFASSIDVTNARWIGSNAFANCSMLESISLPKVIKIYSGAFDNCTKLSKITLNENVVCTLGNPVFNMTPIANSTLLGYWGSVFVPSQLVSYYQVETNWVSISDRITSITEW